MKKLIIFILIFPFLSSLKAGNSSLDKELFTAMQDNNLKRFKFFLRKGANPNAKNESGNSLLHLSIKETRFPFAEALIENNVDLNFRDEKGNTALHLAAEKMRYYVVEKLIKAGADVNAVNEDGKTALHISVSSGTHGNKVRALIEAGASINTKDKNGKTALHFFVLNKDYSGKRYHLILSFLLKNGADVNAIDHNGISVLMEALKTQRMLLSEIFISHGANPSHLDQFIINRYGKDFFNKIPNSPDKKLKAIKGQLQRLNSLGKKLPGHKTEKKSEISFTDKDLFKAMEENDLKRFKFLLKNGANVNAKNENGDSLVHLSIKQTRFRFTEVLIESNADINVRDNKQNTPLHLTMKDMSLNPVFKMLMKKGADVNAINEDGKNPLHLLVLSGSQINKMKALIEAGVDTNAKDNNGKTALHLSTFNKFETKMASTLAADLLIKNGANVNAVDKDGMSVLMEVVKSRRMNLAKFLLKNKAEVNLTDQKGKTALSEAIRLNYISFFRLFLKHGADTSRIKSLKDIPREKLLSYSESNIRRILGTKKNDYIRRVQILDEDLFKTMKEARLRSFRFLLKNGADPNAKNENGESLILLSIKQNRPLFTKALMETDLDIHVRDDQKNSLLHLAFEKSDSHFPVEDLIKKGIDVNAVNENGQTALHLAILNGAHPVKNGAQLINIKALLKAGVNLEAFDKEGKTALMEAVKLNNKTLSKLLISHGANPSFLNQFKAKDLFIAMEENNLKRFNTLLRHGADPNIKNENGDGLLHLSIKNKKLDFFRGLIKANADLNIRDKKNNTPIHLASVIPKTPFTKILIKKGADVNAINDLGQTAAHLISLKGSQKIDLESLIEAGVNINAKDNNGKTALHLAVFNKEDRLTSLDKTISNFLIKKGAHAHTVDYLGNTPLMDALKLHRLNLSKLLITYAANPSDLNQFIKDQYGKEFFNQIPDSVDEKFKAIRSQMKRIDSRKRKDKKALKQSPPKDQAIPKDKVITTGSLLKEIFDETLRDFGAEKLTENLLKVSSDKANKTKEKSFAKHGPDVNKIDENGQTALHRIVSSGHRLEKIKDFIETGEDINAKDKDGKSPLHLAVLNEHRNGLNSRVDYLIKNGADINALDNNGRTALMETVKARRISLSRLLLEHKAKVNLADKEGKTALSEAVSLKSEVLFRLLLEYEADPSGIELLKGISRERLLSYHRLKVRDILDGKRTKENKKEQGDEFLAFVREEKKRLKKQSGIEEFNKLLEAMEKNELLKFKEILLDIVEEKKLNLKGENGVNLIHLSVEKEKKNFFNLLIEAHDTLDIVDAEGNTPLHWAVLGADTYYTDQLLQYGADPNIKNEIGKTPMHFASSFKEKGLAHMEMLLRSKADLNALDEKGKSPLHYATLTKDFNKIRFFIRNKANLNLKDKNGNSPLHELSEIKTSHQTKEQLEYLAEIAKVLIENGAKVNETDKQGKTPLMKAIESNNLALSRALIFQKAVIFTSDYSGKKALDYALNPKVSIELRDLIRVEIDRQDKLNQSVKLNRIGEASRIKVGAVKK